MDDSIAREAPWSPIQFVVWVVLLFVLLFLCISPFLARGVTLPGLGKVPGNSLLFFLCVSGMTLSGFTPMLSAILVLATFPRAGGVRPYLRQIKTWRVPAFWYAIALLGPFVLLFLDEGANLLRGGTLPRQWVAFPSPSNPGPGGLAFFCVPIVLSFTEEFGWRGFALPRLQKRYGALSASIIVGVIWGTYHLWIMPICPHCLSLTDVLVTQYLRLIATAVIYGWIYNSAKGTLFLACLAHAGHNIAVGLMPGVGGSPVMVALSYGFVAIVVVFLTHPRTLTRDKS